MRVPGCLSLSLTSGVACMYVSLTHSLYVICIVSERERETYVRDKYVYKTVCIQDSMYARQVCVCSRQDKYVCKASMYQYVYTILAASMRLYITLKILAVLHASV